MFDTESLAKRISAEFELAGERNREPLGDQLSGTEQRQDRLEQLNKVFDELREIWKPRLELLVREFEDRVKAVAHFVPSMRHATFYFQSSFAHVQLRFTASTDRDVQRVILSYLLEITPEAIHYKSYDKVEFPLNAVDKAAAARWFDDRIMDFVQTYLSLGEPELCPADQMVEDPVSRVRFPNYAAAASLVRNGKKFYFMSEETRHQFEAKQ
jgi:YHS domain-containing protein